MTPKEQLAFELYIEQITDSDTDDVRCDKATLAAARQKAEAFLAKHGLPPFLSPIEESSLASVPTRQFSVRFDGIATLAAADAVKASIPWEGGTVRLIESPMRADLAIEVQVDDDRNKEFSHCVFFIHIEGRDSSLAVIPGGSPVFCKLFADELTDGISFEIDCVPEEGITVEHIDSLKRSRRALRDPSGRSRYNELLSRVGETGV